MQHELTLVIGNRDYSSWPLRAWLMLTLSNIAFRERRVPLFPAQWQQQRDAINPTGLVPVLSEPVCATVAPSRIPGTPARRRDRGSS
jgi:glutathione S-transferase